MNLVIVVYCWFVNCDKRIIPMEDVTLVWGYMGTLYTVFAVFL